jgi:hypothetical protein
MALAPNEINANPQDLIDTLSQQRDAAMNEIVKMSAMIRALQRELDALKNPQPEATNVEAS